MTVNLVSADVLARLSRHVPLEDIPPTEDLFLADELAEWLRASGAPPFDLVVGGDVMLAERAKPFLALHGPQYPFEAVLPLLDRAAEALANLEGPLASRATRQKTDRHFSYRVSPLTAAALAHAGIRLLTLANNHLMDCGPEGVLETLDVLKRSDIRAVGAGLNASAAHAPAIVSTPNGTLGVLGYYWNRRCAATATRPGGAMDDDVSLERDIPALRRQVDFLLVTCHWGVPYERSPSDAERQRARRAIDLGADAVVAHHPHVIQPCEIYRGCPIFYSVGNFAFGSGNTRAEGLLVGFRYDAAHVVVDVYPLYVKNRDPRVSYQPKVMRGPSAARVLRRLTATSNGTSTPLTMEGPRAVLRLPRRHTGT